MGVNPLFVRKGFGEYAGTLFRCQGARPAVNQQSVAKRLFDPTPVCETMPRMLALLFQLPPLFTRLKPDGRQRRESVDWPSEPLKKGGFPRPQQNTHTGYDDLSTKAKSFAGILTAPP